MAPPSRTLSKSPPPPPPSNPPPPPATSNPTRPPEGEVLADLPGWASPPESPATSPPPPAGAAAGEGVGIGPDLSGPGPTREPPTRFGRLHLGLRSGSVDPDTKKLLTEAAYAVLATIGRLLQLRFASPARYGPNEVFRPDADDRDHIAEPLASMVGRRSPGGLEGDSDAGDLLVAAIGLGGYAVKNVERRSALIRAAGGWSDLERGEPGAPAAGAGDDLTTEG